MGRALVRRLHRSGLSVRALVEPSERADELGTMGSEIASTNLADRDSIEEALNGADVLYHTAETNLDGTQSIFEACIRRGVPHVVYLSSIAVYGLAQKGQHIDENAPYDPHSCL
jgi:nucleoside-diphosphate-sugar epimerase